EVNVNKVRRSCHSRHTQKPSTLERCRRAYNGTPRAKPGLQSEFRGLGSYPVHLPRIVSDLLGIPAFDLLNNPSCAYLERYWPVTFWFPLGFGSAVRAAALL